MAHRRKPDHSGEGAGLRASRTPFVGRESELEQVDSHIGDGARLVTVTGAPGAGKTRLAREFGMRRRNEGADVVFCELSTADDRSDVVRTVAEVLEVSVDDTDDGPPLADRIARALDERADQVVILDNFEHLTDVADGLVSSWLDGSAADFIVTSRERLGVVGEHCVELRPLEETDAIELFVARARMIRPDFELDDDLRETTAELVERLDGLPLALELAAGRVRTLPPAELLQRLDRRFQLLRSRDPVGDRRDRTLEAAIAWSWELLEADERELLRRTTVFRGGFSLDAAEAVVDFDGEVWVGDLLESLVRKSLLYTEPSRAASGRIRFQLYESIREFVLRTASSPEQKLCERHAAYYAEVGREWGQKLGTATGSESLQHLRTESSNLEAAFAWAREHDPERAVDLGRSLDRLLRLAGPIAEHADVVEKLCEAAERTGDPGRVAGALLARGRLESMRGNLECAARDCRRARQRAAEAELERPQARATFTLGEIERRRGDLAEACDRFEQTLEIAGRENWPLLERLALAYLAAGCADLEETERAASLLESFDAAPPGDDLRRECRAVRRAANAHFYLHNFAAQRNANRRALELSRTISDRKLEGLALQGLGLSDLGLGNLDAAVEHLEEALQIHRRHGNVHYEGVVLGNLGSVLHRQSNLVRARDHYEDALEIHLRTGAEPYEATVRFALGVLHFEREEYAEARRLLERSAQLWDANEGHDDDAAASRWSLGWLAAAEMHLSAAADAFRTAADRFGAIDATGWQRLSEWSKLFVERLQTSASAETPEPDERFESAFEDAERTVRQLGQLVARLDDAVFGGESPDAIRRVARDGEEEAPLFEQSLYGRVATLAAEHLLERHEEADLDESSASKGAATEDADLVVGPEGRWFQRDTDDPADLRRRGALRRILDELADRHEEPGAPLDVYDMFDVGWPDQEIDPDNAADRVYWAVRELRKAGLEEILQTTDDGYVLDPDLQVVRSNRATPE